MFPTSTELFICLIYVLACAFILFKAKCFSDEVLTRKKLLLFFGLKLLAGFVYLYWNYHSKRSDSLDYFSDSITIFERTKSNIFDFVKIVLGVINQGSYFDDLLAWGRGENFGFYNDDQTIVRLNLILRPLNFGYYYVNSVLYIFISMLSCILLYKGFSKLFTEKRYLFMNAFFLIPSVIFWTSIGSKEVIALLFLAVLFYALTYFHEKKTLKHILFLILSLILIYHTKIYIKIAVLGMLIFILISSINIVKKQWHAFVITASSFLLITIIFSLVNSPYNPLEILELKRTGFIEWMAMDGIAENNRSTFEMIEYKKDFLTILLVLFEAIFNFFFRPLITDCYDLKQIVNSLENILFAYILLLFIFKRKNYLEEKESFWVFSLLVFVGISLLIVGITVPNSGALVRYKSVIIPFVMALSIIIVDTKKLSKFFRTNILND
jgi:hypothetical protein